MKNFLTRNWMYRILALLLAIALFTYVKTERLSSTRFTGVRSNNNSILMSNKTSTITMPVDLDINNSQYIVTGYPAKVKIELTGPSALVATTVNTQNFKVYLGLRGLSTGTHRVSFKTSGLNKDLSAQVEPSTTKVTIAERKTESFDIQTRFDKNLVKKGYVVGTPQLSSLATTATGSTSDIEKISQVVADVSIPKDTKSDLHAQVMLQALDSRGYIVNVILSPQTINVTLPISKQSDKQKSDDKQSEGSSTSSSQTSSSSTNQSN